MSDIRWAQCFGSYTKALQPNEASAVAMRELVEGKGHFAESLDALLAELTDGKVTHE